MEPHKPFSTHLYKRETIIVDHEMGGFTIPNDTPRDRPRRQLRQRATRPEGDELPIISTEDDMLMDPYSVVQRRLTTWHGGGITPT